MRIDTNKRFDWSEDKNIWLKNERGVNFDDFVLSINKGSLITITPHPNKVKYSNQQMFIVKIEDYIYTVPFVEDEEKYFLKTIYPSRKLTKKYLK
jgi:hypothetical protein